MRAGARRNESARAAGALRGLRNRPQGVRAAHDERAFDAISLVAWLIVMTELTYGGDVAASVAALTEAIRRT